MIFHLKRIMPLLCFFLVIPWALYWFFCSTALFAADLNDSGSPSSPASAMYTLDDIYNRLTAGTQGAKRTGGFNGPSSGPASSCHTLNELMDAAPKADAAGAVSAEVLTGKEFWGLNSGAWGPRTGSMADREGDNASTAQARSSGVNYFTPPEGYYDGDDRVSATDAQVAALDADISSGNILSTVAIFGVAGTHPPAGAPETGQTYDPADGSDGDLQKGISWPTPRFTRNGDTVTDNMTGLMWAEDANGAGTLNWAAAVTYCTDLVLGGHSDWRLPNVNELLSLIDYAYEGPALSNGAGTGQWTTDEDAFSNVQSGEDAYTRAQTAKYWTSTIFPDVLTDAYYVDLDRGFIFHAATATAALSVWPVRGGQ